jgi:hypothetical protein
MQNPINIPNPVYSIVSSWFNVEKMSFDWRGALENWLDFQNGTGQIVIAINTSVDDSPKIVREWVKQWKSDNPMSQTRVEIIDIEIPYDQPDFDGRGKAAATAAASEPYVILLDCDERIAPSTRRAWDRMAVELETGPYDAFLVPVIDLIGDERTYSKVGSKWYIHKNSPNITRGVVKWAYREDGTWDKTKSDSCEAIYRDTQELVKSAPIIMTGLPMWMQVAQMESGEVPFIYHLGALDLKQRVKQSAFWRPIWNLRDSTAKEPELTEKDLDEIPRFRHSLPSWRKLQ